MITIRRASVSHREEPLFALRVPQVLQRQRLAFEHERSVGEVQAVLASVRLALRFVPLEPHCIYKL